MLFLTRRVHLIRVPWARQIAIGIACLTILLSFGSIQEVESQERLGTDKPRPVARRSARIKVYITWLDSDNAILALRRPPPLNRIVFGIGQPLKGSDLHNISGFGEVVPPHALAEFRAALAQKAVVQPKYQIYRLDPPSGPTIDFNRINSRFHEYVRSTTKRVGDLNIWNVDFTGGKTTIVSMGELVLVSPHQTNTPETRAEEAMIRLLENVALKENKGIQAVTFQSGCTNASAAIEAVWQDPLNDQPRLTLRQSLASKMIGDHSDSDENQFEVTNAGWISRVLHVEVRPTPGFLTSFTVTSSLGGQSKEITRLIHDLELPPCAIAQISVAPLRWYETFPVPTTFEFSEADARLTVQAFTPGVRWSLIFIGLGVVLIGLGLWLMLTLKQYWHSRRRALRSVGRGRIEVRPERIVLEAPKPDVIESPQSLTTSPPASSSTPHLLESLQQFSERNRYLLLQIERLEETHIRLKEVVQPQTLKHLEILQTKLDAEQTEHRRWQEVLKELGDSPDAIVRTSLVLRQRQEALQKRCVELEVSLRQAVERERDEHICRARLITRGIQKAGQQLREIAEMDADYTQLFSGSGMEITNVAQQLLELANSSDAALTQALIMQEPDSDRDEIEQIVTAFLHHILAGRSYIALLNMLRLWQVIETYCRHSVDSLVQELHVFSKEYQRNCEQILSDFACLGVRFHKIRFLQDPQTENLIFTEAVAIPPIQFNSRLMESIRNRLESNFDKYWKTIADVSVWGLECDLDPELNLRTELWLWRSLAR